jgi:hypothetical protein
MSGPGFAWAVAFGALAFGMAYGMTNSLEWGAFWAAAIGSFILGLRRFHELSHGEARFDLIDGIVIAGTLGFLGWLMVHREQTHGTGNEWFFLSLLLAPAMFGGGNLVLRIFFTLGGGLAAANSRPRARTPEHGGGRGGGIDPGRFGYGRGGEAGPGPYGEEPFPPPYGRGRPGGTYAGEEGTDAPRLEEAWTPEGYSTQDAARYFQITGITGSASSTEQAREFARRIKLGLGGDAPGYAFLAAGARDHHLPKHIRAFYAHALQLCDRGQA